LKKTSTKFFLKKNRKPIQVLLMLGSLAGAAAINYNIVHNPLVFIMIATLFVHEIGHYLVAKYNKANPDYPYFIPLFPILLGVTRIKNLKDEHRSSVAIAGMIFASIFLLTMISYNFLFKIYSTFSLFIILLLELVLNYIGSDGKKYRKYKKYSTV
jgi:hypothetical protein